MGPLLSNSVRGGAPLVGFIIRQEISFIVRGGDMLLANKNTYTTQSHILRAGCSSTHNDVAGSSTYYLEGHMISNIIGFAMSYSDGAFVLVVKITNFISIPL